uniref:SF3 helicase domain-containing protein n=1 Tax=viral metagenome TaxID=1070528 RepID=A0A6C0F934_9ZZZZ|tara:strand:- start:23824 stop:27081 length:3258 start_codon:yes stop_codon:yes gene_type:complete
MNYLQNQSTSRTTENNDNAVGYNGFRDSTLLQESMEISAENTEEPANHDISDFNLEWDASRYWRTKYWNKTGVQGNELRNMGKENEFTHIIAKDCGVEDGAKHFFMSKKPHGDFVNYLFSRPPSERFYYEVLAPHKPVKLYFDLETDPGEGQERKTDLEWQGIKAALITRTIQELELWFPEQFKAVGGITHDDFIVINASGKDKKKGDKEKSSYHLILARKLAFESVDDLHKWVEEVFFSKPPEMMDTSVYKTWNQSMRLAENIKKADPHERFLVIEDFPGIDACACKEIRESAVIQTPKKRKMTKKFTENRREFKKMILESMITYVPATMKKLKVDMRQLKKKRAQDLKIVKETVKQNPDALPTSASQNDVLLHMCRSLVEKDKDYVDKQPNWIKIGRLLKSAGAEEEVWINFSNMGSKPDPEEKLKEQWRYFGTQRHMHDPEMFFNYVRKRCPSAVENAKMFCISRMDSGHNSIAQGIKTLFSEKVVFDAKQWYYKEGIHWIIDDNCRRLGELIMNDFHRELDQTIKVLKAKNMEITDNAKGGDLSPEDLESKAINSARLDTYNEIKSITQAGRLGKDRYPLEVYLARPGFVENLDKRTTIIAFDNGIIDLQGKPVVDKDGNPVIDTVYDYDGQPRIDENGNKIKKVRREVSDFELREPEQYEDENGKPQMEFVSKSCGYNYISKSDIMDEKKTNIAARQAYVRHLKNWNKYLKEVFPEDEEREAVKYFLATCLDGSINNEEIYIWTGISKYQNGANGKSKFKDIISQVFGDYCGTCSPQLLTQTEPGAHQANSAMMCLKGLRLAFFDEPQVGKNGTFKMGFVKRMTGGDQISARELYGSNQTFVSQAKPIVLTNEIPFPDSTDGGVLRRFKFFPFLAKFVEDTEDPKWKGIDVQPRDPELNKKIVDWKLPIIHQLLEYYVAFNSPAGEALIAPGGKKMIGKGKKHPKSKVMMSMFDDFTNNIDVIKPWISENCVADPQGVLFFRHLKAHMNDDIKALYKHKVKDLIEDVSQRGGLGPYYGSKQYSPKEFKLTAYTRPCDGTKHGECWGGWRMKTQEERDAEDEMLEVSVTRGVEFQGAFDEE